MPSKASNTDRDRVLRLVGFAVGVAAFLAAGFAIRGNLAQFRGVLEKGVRPELWVPLLAFPLASLLATALVVHVLTNARLEAARRLSFGEMFDLIGASWLLNFLPLSPGLFGRIAYQKSRHGITIKASAAVVLESIILSWLAVIVVVPIVFVSNSLFDPMGAVLLLGGLFWWISVRTFGRHSLAAARMFAFLLKIVDQCCWAGRYFIVFRILGWQPTLAEACAIAAIAQIAMLVPFIGNGLGIREWVVGLMATSLPAWFRGSGDPGTTLQLALAADLLNRAFEVAVAIPVGLFCLARLRVRTATGPIYQSETAQKPKNVNPS